jgi:hypothetical protein
MRSGVLRLPRMFLGSNRRVVDGQSYEYWTLVET